MGALIGPKLRLGLATERLRDLLVFSTNLVDGMGWDGIDCGYGVATALKIVQLSCRKRANVPKVNICKICLFSEAHHPQEGEVFL